MCMTFMSFFQIKAPFIVKAGPLTTAKELAQSYQHGDVLVGMSCAFKSLCVKFLRKCLRIPI